MTTKRSMLLTPNQERILELVKELAALRAVNERLRAALTQIADFPNPYSDQACDQMLSEAKGLAREALRLDEVP